LEPFHPVSISALCRSMKASRRACFGKSPGQAQKADAFERSGPQGNLLAGGPGAPADSSHRREGNMKFTSETGDAARPR
jgi:hypothetical protein